MYKTFRFRNYLYCPVLVTSWVCKVQHFCTELSNYFSPLQYIQPDNSALVRLDFSNAFNSLSLNQMLEVVANVAWAPDPYFYIAVLPSVLKHGNLYLQYLVLKWSSESAG